MTNPINKIATFLYVQHKTFLGEKDLKLDLSSNDELKIVQDTWQNRLALFFKNLFSRGTRNETILRLAKEAWAINNCDTLEALQNVDIKWTESAPITDEVAERFALMQNGKKTVQAAGRITLEKKDGQISLSGEHVHGTAAEYFTLMLSSKAPAPDSITVTYKQYQNPLVDVGIIPMGAVRGIRLPAPFQFSNIPEISLPKSLADKVNSTLSLSEDLMLAHPGNEYGDVKFVVTK